MKGKARAAVAAALSQSGERPTTIAGTVVMENHSRSAIILSESSPAAKGLDRLLNTPRLLLPAGRRHILLAIHGDRDDLLAGDIFCWRSRATRTITCLPRVTMARRTRCWSPEERHSTRFIHDGEDDANEDSARGSIRALAVLEQLVMLCVEERCESIGGFVR